jgi:hypothetical protein
MSIMKRSTINANSFPFDENGITSLLFLEESHEKYRKDKGIIKQLIESYAKLVEFYDTMKDPVKLYFMDKMQSVLVNYNKRENQNFSNNHKKQRDEININKNENQMENNIKNNNSLSTSIPMQFLKKSDKFYELRRNKRIQEMKMDDQIKKKDENFENEFLNNMKDYEKKNSINTSVIKDQLKIQTSSIQEKLQKRRDKSMSKSIERSFMNRGNKQLAKSQLVQKNDKDDKKKGFMLELEKFENNVGNIKVDKNILMD